MTAKERYKEYSVKVKEYETDFLKLVEIEYCFNDEMWWIFREN